MDDEWDTVDTSVADLHKDDWENEMQSDDGDVKDDWEDSDEEIDTAPKAKRVTLKDKQDAEIAKAEEEARAIAHQKANPFYYKELRRQQQLASDLALSRDLFGDDATDVADIDLSKHSSYISNQNDGGFMDGDGDDDFMGDDSLLDGADDKKTVFKDPILKRKVTDLGKPDMKDYATRVNGLCLFPLATAREYEFLITNLLEESTKELKTEALRRVSKKLNQLINAKISSQKDKKKKKSKKKSIKMSRAIDDIHGDEYDGFGAIDNDYVGDGLDGFM